MPQPKINSDAAENLSARQGESTGFVYIAAAIAALGGLLFGYDTGVISGALIFVQKSFALSTFHQELVVSVVLVGAAVGSLGGGNLADHIGRKTNLLITSVIFILGAIICAAAGSEITLIVGRTIVGLGIGLASSTVPLYISEVSPAKARGWQVSLFQLAITIGTWWITRSRSPSNGAGCWGLPWCPARCWDWECCTCLKRRAGW
jgi:SP family galactose:H+ symporter-like MFS transporter